MECLFTILVPILAGAMVVILAKRMASHSFTCKHCSRQFRIKWTKVIVTQHIENEYLLVCPHCQTKDWCIQQ